ncbi:MAG: ester cyclase [Pseudomonadota bacterium]
MADLLRKFRAALYDYDGAALREAMDAAFTPDALMQLAHPFETLDGPHGFADVLAMLASAMPDMERRDWIVMDGIVASGDCEGARWIGCGGHYTGTFVAPFLDIPPTGHQAAMRFHEFFRVEDGKVTEMQALWDIPELMMQADAWPMVPSLGREWLVPAPVTQNGLGPHDEARTGASHDLVWSMLNGLTKHAEGGVEAMGLEAYWHPKFSWYGPAGIGTTRGISGFRQHHQIPFLNGMPDRVGSAGAGNLFAAGDYVGFTAWPGMHMTISDDGWLGIPPLGKRITMRSLDFWRCENGLIRENWVLVDLLHVYHQIGVDVLVRMRELTKPMAQR